MPPAIVHFDKSGVLVNNTMQTELPDVYALGNVTGGATKVTDANLTTKNAKNSSQT